MAAILFMIVLGAGAAAWGFWRWNTRPVRIEVSVEPPAAFPERGFSHAAFEGLLARFTGPSGAVDYAAWHADGAAVAELDSYLAAVARYSPETSPGRFTENGASLVYWVQAYNAFVIKAVLLHWPIGSVTDYRAPVEMVKGLGFFYKLRFTAGGRSYSLYEIERDKVIAPARDPRTHFILNCASASCPAIRPRLPEGPGLEAVLERAAAEFTAAPENVSVDHGRRRIRLSALFKWYEKDFVGDLRRRGLPAERGVVDYVRAVAPDPVRRELERASEYPVEFADYDWTLKRPETRK